MKIQVGTAATRSRRAWADANVSIIGATAGSIIAAIITVHTPTNTRAAPNDQPIDATQALNRSTGVSNSRTSRPLVELAGHTC
jgi:hypothetical protein